MGSNSVLLPKENNSSDVNAKKAESFFKQLAEDHSLHEKLETVSWIAQDEFRGLAILSRTLFLFTMDIRDERDKAREDLSRISKENARIKSILCSACKQNVPQGEKENCVPEQAINISCNKVTTANGHATIKQSTAKNSSLDRKQLRELKISNNEYRCLSRSPKKNGAQTSPDNKVNEGLTHAIFSNHPETGEEIFAPETQALVIDIPKEPVDGRTSVPETMAMEDDPVPLRESYRNTDFFDDSKDVFEDSISVDEDPSEYFTQHNKTGEALTYTHISPVLGRGGFGNKDSPFRRRARLNDGFSSSSGSSSSQSISELSNSQSNAETTDKVLNAVSKIQAKYETDASPITNKIVNITVSPNCQSEVELQSPSLLNVVQQRKITSQPIGSQVFISNKSPYKCNSNNVALKLPAPLEVSDECKRKNIPSVNLLSSQESTENILNEELQPSSSIEVITDKKQNSSPDELPSLYQNKTSPHDRATTSADDGNITVPKRTIPNVEPSSVIKKSSALITDFKKDSANDQDSSSVTDKSLRTSDRILGGSLTRASNRSLSLAGANTFLNGKKNMTRHQSHTVTVQGSKLYNKIEVNPAATIKKNYKQTKLTADSFFASKKKGNLDVSDDPLLAVAVAKSLETKELDDRRRLQLHHPALRQLQQHDSQANDTSVGNLTATRQEQSSAQCQGWIKPAGKKKKASGGRHSSPPRPKRRSNEGVGDVEGQAANQPSAKRPRVGSPAHGSMLTESQIMSVINDTTITEECTQGVSGGGTPQRRGGRRSNDGATTPDKRVGGGQGKDSTPEKRVSGGQGKDSTPQKRGVKRGKDGGGTPQKRVDEQDKEITPRKRGGRQSKDGGNAEQKNTEEQVKKENRLSGGENNHKERKQPDEHLREGGKETSPVRNESVSRREVYSKNKSPVSKKKMKHDLEDAEKKSEMGAIGLAAASLCRRRQAEMKQQDHKLEAATAPKNKRKSDDATRDQATRPIQQDKLSKQSASNEDLSANAKERGKGKKQVQNFSDSFDCLPPATASPGYAYAGPVERNQAKRRQMPGWSCKQCKDYYEGRGLTDDQLVEQMNRCSKHRSKHQPLPSTPAGYWDPEMTYTDSESEA